MENVSFAALFIKSHESITTLLDCDKNIAPPCVGATESLNVQLMIWRLCAPPPLMTPPLPVE